MHTIIRGAKMTLTIALALLAFLVIAPIILTIVGVIMAVLLIRIQRGEAECRDGRVE
jgi:hypothetical protein